MDARIKSGHDELGGSRGWPIPRTMVRCTGSGGVGQHRWMSQKTSREHSHAMQNETPRKFPESTPKSTTAGTFGRSSIDRLPAKLREAVDRGHRGRRHHRRDHRPHPRRRRDMLALGRRPLRQEHARHDPPAAGDRPHHQGVGGRAGRTAGGLRGALPDRDPADHGALHHGSTSAHGKSPCRRRSSPASPSPSSASRAPTSSAKTGSGRQRRRRTTQTAPSARAGSRRRPSPSSARRWRAGPRRRLLPAPSRRCRWTRGIPQSSPQSRSIPANLTCNPG